MGEIRENKVIKNASWLIGGKIIQSVLGFLISMVTVRYLGPSNYGLVNYAASIVNFVVPLANLGLASVLVQETVKYPEEEGKIYGTTMGISIVSSIVCIIGIIGFVSVANAGQRDVIIVCALYSVGLIFQALELMRYWFQAKYLSKYTAIITLVAFGVISVYKIFLLVAGKSVFWFALISILDYMLIALGQFIVYRKLGGQKLSFSLSVAKRMLCVSRHYIVSSLMITIFVQVDRIMITLMINETANGYYSAAVSCAGIFAFVFSAIIDSMRPKIFESKKIGKEAFELNVSRLYCVITYASLAQCLVMTLFADPIMLIVYGAEYKPAINVLRLVVWYATFSYYGAIRNIWILAENKQKYLWIINVTGAVANVLLNALLIPGWGIMGAAFASLLTQFFTNVVVGFILKPIRYNNRLMLKGLNLKVLKYK